MYSGYENKYSVRHRWCVVLIFGFLLGDKESKVMKAFEGRYVGCRNDVIKIDDL